VIESLNVAGHFTIGIGKAGEIEYVPSYHFIQYPLMEMTGRFFEESFLKREPEILEKDYALRSLFLGRRF
jgi:hypothetical protein